MEKVDALYSYYERGTNLVFVVPKKNHPKKDDTIIIQNTFYIVLGVIRVTQEEIDALENTRVPKMKPFKANQVGLRVKKRKDQSTAKVPAL